MTTMEAERISTGGWIWPRAALGAGIALTANLVIWAIAASIGVEVMIPETPNSEVYVSLTLLPVLLASVLPAVAAAIGLLVLQRVVPGRARRVFQIVVAVVAIMSLGGPLSLDVTTGSRIALVAMHVITAVAIVVAQSRRTGRTGRVTGRG